MTENELHLFLKNNFPKENENCEWKEFKNLKNSINGSEKDDLISYVSAVSNMGGNIVIGIEDKTFEIIDIQNFHNYNVENIKLALVSHCTNLSSENLEISEYITSDTAKTVWIIKVPKHSFRQPINAHKKAWQRIGDSLVAMTKEMFIK
ncbi:MAG: ATP-binding protein [Weeksellaceae bacterium]|nr:ATP-binding protein [Weeksellaceae bacterium]